MILTKTYKEAITFKIQQTLSKLLKLQITTQREACKTSLLWAMLRTMVFLQ